jgi:hypothetical protein
LRAFLAQSDKRGPASVIVFVPAQPGAWLSTVIGVASRRQLRAVIGVDGVAEPKRRARWLTLLQTSLPVPGAHAVALEQVMTTLARARVQVTLLDRTTGRALGEMGRRALFRNGTRTRTGALSRAQPVEEGAS